MKEFRKKKYFVGIWPLIKYNPVGFALFSFVLGNLYGERYNFNSTAIFVLIMLYFIIGAFSDIFGIILLIKTSRHHKRINLIEEDSISFT